MRTGFPAGAVLADLLSVLFPRRCVDCGQPGARLCPDCTAALQPPGPALCRRCGRPSPRPLPDCLECRGRRLYFSTARAAFCYQGPARALARALKYSGQWRLAALMAELSATGPGLTGMAKEATLTCVPLYGSKQLGRGYNQAELYARALARRLDLPFERLLLKSRSTPSQNRLDRVSRRRNLKGSISLRSGVSPAADRIVLVDDVYTTGSTVNECARVLRRELKAEVSVWTFARTVRD